MSASILIRGPLGVGKTTVARLLCSRLGGCYLSVDQVLAEHGLDQGSDGIPARSFRQANLLALPKALEARASGRAVVFDGNFYYKSQIQQLQRRLPAPVFVFTLQAPLDVCIARDAGRERVYGVDAASWVYFLVSRVSAGIPIQTEGKTAPQVVEEIERELNTRKISISG